MRSARHIFQSPLVASVVTGLLCALLILGLRSTGQLQQVELNLYDWLLQSRPITASTHPRITFITLSEDDIRQQGRWPITDETLAQTLEQLIGQKPRAIGVDIYRDIEVPPGHEKLTTFLPQHSQIIMVTQLGGGTVNRIPPPLVLEGSEQIGFNDVVIDPDGLVRRALLFQDDGEQVAYAFALRLALLYLAAEGIAPQPDPSNSDLLRLGPTTFKAFGPSDGGYVNADAGGYQILLDFGGAAAPFQAFSLTDLLAGRVDARHITDRVVLIGVTAESVPDVFHIPVRYNLREGDQFQGVFLHGILVEQLLAAALDGRASIQVMSETAEGAWILLWGILAGGFGVWARSPLRFALIAVGGLFVMTAIVILLFWSGWWIPEAPAALTWFVATAAVVASTLGRERHERALLMQLFSRHVSREVANSIWEQREQLLEGGRPRPQELVVTVLFLDFKGYTAASEKMTPQALMAWVNAYLDAMTQVIMRHDGVIDDYAGDSIKANFGVPLKRVSDQEISTDATHAVACAVAMEQEMHRMNDKHEGEGLPTVGMRIGIHTGPVLAGCVGSAERMKYTTVGDTVNAAARLESLDREVVAETPGRHPCRILISETTARFLNGRFQLERLGEVSVKGKAHAIVTFRVTSSVVERAEA
ncbi:MAG TPA: adenylate/guanylate cyclase domain-containing protein [Nitrospira sp.]|nr:adenylate/guanylate cyclase domain-containing protein [Nitrospira sp.]